MSYRAPAVREHELLDRRYRGPHATKTWHDALNYLLHRTNRHATWTTEIHPGCDPCIEINMGMANALNYYDTLEWDHGVSPSARWGRRPGGITPAITP